MKIFEVTYETDYKDKSVVHTHDYMLLTFIVRALSERIAISKLSKARPDLNSNAFTANEIIDDVYLASDESYDE